MDDNRLKAVQNTVRNLILGLYGKRQWNVGFLAERSLVETLPHNYEDEYTIYREAFKKEMRY